MYNFKFQNISFVQNQNLNTVYVFEFFHWALFFAVLANELGQLKLIPISSWN